MAHEQSDLELISERRSGAGTDCLESESWKFIMRACGATAWLCEARENVPVTYCSITNHSKTVCLRAIILHLLSSRTVVWVRSSAKAQLGDLVGSQLSRG